MFDVFYEESTELQQARATKAKCKIFNILSIVFYALAVLWTSFAIVFYPLSGNLLMDILGMIMPLIFLLPLAIVSSLIKNKFYVVYDYAFISGTIKVSKIFKDVKRKFVIKFNTTDLERFGKYGSDTYHKYTKMPGISKMTFTMNTEPADGKDFYYLVATVNAEKKLMVFECTETFIVNVLKFSNKSIIEEAYK